MSSVSAVRYLPPRFIDVATGAKWVGSTCESSSVSAVCVLPASYTAVRPSTKCIAGCFFSCAFFAGVIHICIPGGSPRSPRLGEVAEF